MQLHRFAIVVSLIVVSLLGQLSVDAKPLTSSELPSSTLRLSDSATLSASLEAFVEALMQASNQHDIDAVIRAYSLNYQSGDGLDRDDLRQMIQRTWELYPDIQYTSVITSAKEYGDYAVLETLDTAHAATDKPHPRVGLNGKLDSESRNQLVLQKVGDRWEITSDSTLFESARIAYGIPDNFDAKLEVAPQVKPGDLYSGKLRVTLPKRQFALASIDREAITYPPPEAADHFRTMSGSGKLLERVFEANSLNRNELVTATVGLGEITRDKDQRPDIQIKGVLTLVQRVNVLANAQPVPNGVEEVVRTSADGRVRFDSVDTSNARPNPTQ